MVVSTGDRPAAKEVVGQVTATATEWRGRSAYRGWLLVSNMVLCFWFVNDLRKHSQQSAIFRSDGR